MATRIQKRSFFRAVRDIIRDISTFGDKELEAVKHRLEQQKVDLEKLREARKIMKDNEEAIVLASLRSAVSQLKQEESKRLKLEREFFQNTEHIFQKLEAQVPQMAHARMAKMAHRIKLTAKQGFKPDSSRELRRSTSKNPKKSQQQSMSKNPKKSQQQSRERRPRHGKENPH